jgi:hypothetical protein
MQGSIHDEQDFVKMRPRDFKALHSVGKTSKTSAAICYILFIFLCCQNHRNMLYYYKAAMALWAVLTAP